MHMDCNSYPSLLMIEYQNLQYLKVKVLLGALISNLDPSTSIYVHHQKKVEHKEPIPVHECRWKGLGNQEIGRQNDWGNSLHNIHTTKQHFENAIWHLYSSPHPHPLIVHWVSNRHKYLRKVLKARNEEIKEKTICLCKTLKRQLFVTCLITGTG